MVGDQGVLIILENLLSHCRVHNLFRAKLLMVVCDLHRIESRVVHRDVGDCQGIWASDVWCVVISSESNHNSTDAWLLKSSNIDCDVCLACYRTMVWCHIPDLYLVVVVEDLAKGSYIPASIDCQLDIVEIFRVLIVPA